ncbi:hypothetical protein R6Q59_028402 [Mikania micrantha]
MASISTCFTITPKYHAKPFIYSLRPHNDVFHKEYLKLGRHHSGSNSKNLPSEIRASFNVPPVDATARVRPGKIIESDKLPTDVRKRVMDAVDTCGRRVTVGDVASKAGIKLTEAQRALQAIAADTNGFLESGAEYLIRVTFGTALIASIVIVYTTIIAILTSSSEEDNRGRRRGRSFDSGFSFYLSPTDLFWYWDPYYYRRRRVRSEDNGMNFIESICQYIASNGGVVTAEELAPYLDVETAETTDDDSYILPVLLRFDGQPEVDEEGNILYRFPSLQRTVASKRSGRKEYVGRTFSEWVGGLDKFFKERKWDFSKISNTERAMVVGLGGLNLFGVIVLGTMLKDVGREKRVYPNPKWVETFEMSSHYSFVTVAASAWLDVTAVTPLRCNFTIDLLLVAESAKYTKAVMLMCSSFLSNYSVIMNTRINQNVKLTLVIVWAILIVAL